MEIIGKVHEVGATQNVTESFKKRNLIVAVSDTPQFVEYISIEFQQNNVDKLDGVSVGQVVNVGINLRGRPWTNKEGVTQYFNTIVGWRVNKVEDSSDLPAEDVTGSDSEDLPF